jgi:small subunit ribosomal protein S17
MRERGVRKKLIGVVVGTKMDKTVVVLVKRLKKHNTYNKYIRRNTKYLAHDPENTCETGDRVKITESRPISKLKRWQVVEIVEKAEFIDSKAENDQDQELQ